jgi:predicted dinucleotide-binding enzyme
MRIGILGTGDVGRALGLGFLGRGDTVMLGTRNPQREEIRAWVGGHDRAFAGTFAEAAAFGEIGVLALLGSAVEATLTGIGPEPFNGKVLLDATNPLDHATTPPTLFVGTTDSLGERVQRLLPLARVVKAYNSIGHALMIHPQLPGGPPDMFIAGDDVSAKETVAMICADFGWGVVDTGGILAARYLEPLAMVWVSAGVSSGRWDIAFRLLRGEG